MDGRFASTLVFASAAVVHGFKIQGPAGAALPTHQTLGNKHIRLGHRRRGSARRHVRAPPPAPPSPQPTFTAPRARTCWKRLATPLKPPRASAARATAALARVSSKETLVKSTSATAERLRQPLPNMCKTVHRGPSIPSKTQAGGRGSEITVERGTDSRGFAAMREPAKRLAERSSHVDLSERRGRTLVVVSGRCCSVRKCS